METQKHNPTIYRGHHITQEKPEAEYMKASHLLYVQINETQNPANPSKYSYGTQNMTHREAATGAPDLACDIRFA
jgi:hypothetical protein